MIVDYFVNTNSFFENLLKNMNFYHKLADSTDEIQKYYATVDNHAMLIYEENKNYVHKERRFSSMSRSLYLDDAKSTGIKAKLENGVLSIIVPKENKPNKSVKIDIE